MNQCCCEWWEEERKEEKKQVSRDKYEPKLPCYRKIQSQTSVVDLHEGKVVLGSLIQRLVLVHVVFNALQEVVECVLSSHVTVVRAAHLYLLKVRLQLKMTN